MEVGNFPYRHRYNTDVATAPLSPTEFTTAVSAITSAFGDPTRRHIYLFSHEHDEGVTAAEVAQQFDLHPNVARHHLDKLAAGGYLEVRLARIAGAGAGRPSKRYRRTSDGVELGLAVRHDDLLVSLLGRALALLPPAAAEAMAEEVGASYGRALAASLGPAAPRTFRAALHTVADALSAHGFAAHDEVSEHGIRNPELRLVHEHCPFGDLAIEHPVLCAVDRGMVTGMLAALHGEATATTAASRPCGDDVCVTVFRT